MSKRWSIDVRYPYTSIPAQAQVCLSFHEHDPLNDGYELSWMETVDLVKDLIVAAKVAESKGLGKA